MTTISELQSLSSVPKLETNGSNWIIFQTWLRWALEDKQVFGHLDGTAIKPADTEGDEKMEIWQKNETKARQLLAQKLYDSTLTKLLHYKTVVEMWAVITQEYSVKSGHVVAAMTTSFNSLKCADNANVRAHLDKLRLRYEELIGVGVTIFATDYATRIIGSLPAKYQHHLSTIEASARASAVAAAAATPANPTAIAAAKSFSISADLLIQLATEEFSLPPVNKVLRQRRPILVLRCLLSAVALATVVGRPTRNLVWPGTVSHSVSVGTVEAKVTWRRIALVPSKDL